jgi:membrane dipeptidase
MSTSLISRRNALVFLGAGFATGLAGRSSAAAGLSLTEAQLQAGVEFLGRHPSVDVHAHPGRFFLRDIPRTDASERLGAPAEAQVLADMAAGKVTAALFACVSDASLLGFTPAGGLAPVREFRPGEAWAEYQRQIALLKAMAARGEVASGLTGRDIAKALKARKTAAVFTVEGGDFIEDRMDRVHQAHADGVRAITIVHYHPNQIGDPQTETPRTPGLTPTGRRIVREMNKAGIVVDLAHASYGVTKDAVAVSDRPMMISHTNLKRADLDHPRLVSVEHARLVTSHGGLVGSVPSGVGQASVGDWIASILRLIDAVGVDHVAIGTDMDANYKPVFTDYRDWAVIPAALLARGLGEAETAKVMGGNFLRIFPT